MRAAVFQFDVTDDPQRNLAEVTRALGEAASEGVELLVLPEMWPTSFPAAVADEEALAATEQAWQQVRELSAKYELCVAGTGFARARELPTNRMRVVDRGEEVLTYDKVHLFSPTAEDASFSAGRCAPPAVETSAGKLSVATCYDLRFPGLLDAPWRAGFDLLLVSAQWPIARLLHWSTLVRARAIERQCFVIACNRAGTAEVGRRKLRLHFPGNSMLVSPLGELLVEAGEEPGLYSAELELGEARRYRTRIPLHKDERPEVYDK